MTVTLIITKALKLISSYQSKDWESKIAAKVDQIIVKDVQKLWTTFMTNEDAELWGGEAFKTSIKEIIEEHEHEYIYGNNYNKLVRSCRRAIENYCGYYHTKVNDLLRFNHRHFGDYQSDQIIEFLDARLDKSFTPENIIIARWVKEGSFTKAFPNLRIGIKIKDKGYLSTSLNIRYVHGYDNEPKRNFDKELLLLIKVPKGSSCLYVGNFGNRSHEQEVLLPRNTTLLVESIHEVYYSRKVLVCSIC